MNKVILALSLLACPCRGIESDHDAVKTLAALLASSHPSAFQAYAARASPRRTQGAIMQGSRRDTLKLGAASLAALALADSASAKGGQLAKSSFFGSSVSSPFQSEERLDDETSPMGFENIGKRVNNADWQKDASREIEAFKKSAGIIEGIQKSLDKGKYWEARDDLRSQVGSIRNSVLGLKRANPATQKAATDFKVAVEDFDRAAGPKRGGKKKRADVQEAYNNVLSTMKAYAAVL
jgi:hypothetical protein